VLVRLDFRWAQVKADEILWRQRQEAFVSILSFFLFVSVEHLYVNAWLFFSFSCGEWIFFLN
jgi:hypothetical protein